MTNEWAKPEHAEAYLARMADIPHRVEGESTLLSEVPERSKRVLDLRCGDGHLLAMVLERCTNATGIGLDFSPTMLEQARTRFREDDRVTLVEHNMDEPLPELGGFDCVVSSFAIHHCTDERKRGSLRRSVQADRAPVECFATLNTSPHRPSGFMGDLSKQWA